MNPLSDAIQCPTDPIAPADVCMRLRVPLLDHGYLQLIETWGSEESIICAARMSTGKGFLGWGPKECSKCHGFGFSSGSIPQGCADCKTCGGAGSEPGDEKLLRFLWENKHATPFEMAGATFEVQAPIFVFREWHRHRVPFGYNEMSARYTPLPDVNYVPSVERLMLGSDGKNKQAGTIAGAGVLETAYAKEFRRRLSVQYQDAENLYQYALKMGVPKELARVHLPVGRYSRMRATSNLRGWLGFLALRAAPSAQWEIRQYAEALQTQLAQVFPRTLALFAEGRK